MIVNVLRWETWREKKLGVQKEYIYRIHTFVCIVRCASGEVVWGVDMWMLSSEGRSGFTLPTRGPQSIGGIQSH